jgi:hypothetical protein
VEDESRSREQSGRKSKKNPAADEWRIIKEKHAYGREIRGEIMM